MAVAGARLRGRRRTRLLEGGGGVCIRRWKARRDDTEGGSSLTSPATGCVCGGGGP